MRPKEVATSSVLNETQLQSRRDFLTKSALAGLALLPLASVAGCRTSSTEPPPPSGYSSNDVAILATGYNTEVQASSTYVTAAGLNLLVDPFLSIALQFKADHDAHAAAFLSLYNSAKASTDPVLAAPTTNLLTAFPPKSSLPLTSETNVLIYALGLEILAAQVYATLAGGSLATSTGFTSFAKVLKLDANLRISSTNLSLISAATDIAACDMQHAIALRAAIVLFKGQSSATYILVNGQPTGGTTLSNPATFPNYFGSSVTAQNPQAYITLA